MIPTLAFSSDEAMVGVMIPVIAIGGGLLCGIISIICGTIQKTAAVKAQEESRREIAAYVAEGTLSPDDAFKLLSATPDPKNKGRCC